MSKEAILITGGAGFIGSHLCERMVKEGYYVFCIDNLITGKLANIEPLLKEKRFIFIKHDISKSIHIKEKIKWVLHFASPASPSDYLRYPIQTLKAGSLGTHNSLGLAKEKKAGFVLASTSEVYGDPNVHPQMESYWGNVNPIGVRGCYDEAKRFAEAITMAYHRVHRIKTRIIRIFNTYGPKMRMDDGRVIPNFISQALNNKALTVYGKGTQTRSFCYISDLIEGIIRIIKCNKDTLQMSLPFNLGNSKEIKILDLAYLIIKLSESKSKIKFMPLPKDDPQRRLPDVTKAKKLLNWSPKIQLEEGLKETIRWFKKNL